MRKFEKWKTTKGSKLVEVSYRCKRCGGFTKECPDCGSPLKSTTLNPHKWECRKCKHTFTMLDMNDYDKHSRIEKVDS